MPFNLFPIASLYMWLVQNEIFCLVLGLSLYEFMSRFVEAQYVGLIFIDLLQYVRSNTENIHNMVLIFKKFMCLSKALHISATNIYYIHTLHIFLSVTIFKLYLSDMTNQYKYFGRNG